MLTNDTPITKPEDDRFGFDPFARALARAIAEMPAPEGVVIGVNGPWGSGKSSVLNLILYHLDQPIKDDKIKIVRFSPWWLNGTEAIAATFLDDLIAAIGPSLGEKALKTFQNVARRVLRFGSAAQIAGDALHPGAGTIVGAAAKTLEGLLPGDASVEAQHQRVSELLKDAGCRFLVIVDDIDRLAPNEAIEVFKLVKSVGQLSNVIYVLAFDRELAERLVQERFPSEGPHYLEKILQAAFEVPAVSAADIREAFLAEVKTTCPPPEGEDPVRFMNVMLEAVSPLLKSPRDLKRLIGMLHVTWPAVAAEVDRADFVAIEALRLFRSDVYRAIRDSSDRLTGTASRGIGRTKDNADEYDTLFLKEIAEADRPRMRRALWRLFPRLESVWANMHYSDDSEWRRRRRICSAEHFPTYFWFAVAESILPAESVGALIEKAGDPEYLRKTLTDALGQNLKSGKTKASVYLDELLVHATDIPEADIETVISVLFEIAGELDVETDRARGFSIGDNRLRLHWILNSLVRERVPQTTRIPLFQAAMRGASLQWFCDFAERCQNDHKPDSRGHTIREEERFVDEKTAQEFVKEALKRLRAAAKDGGILRQPQPLSLIWYWIRLSPKGVEEVRPKVARFLKDDELLASFVRDAVHVAWSQSAGDLVSRGLPQVKKGSVEALVDVPTFLGRVREVADRITDNEAASFLKSFLETWEKQTNRHDRR